MFKRVWDSFGRRHTPHPEKRKEDRRLPCYPPLSHPPQEWIEQPSSGEPPSLEKGV